MEFSVNMPMTWWLERCNTNPKVPCLKPQRGSVIESAFYPSDVDQISNMNLC